MKKTFLLLISIAFQISINAQTPSVGGIAFVGFQNTAPDGFSFVTLEDIPANTQISFTDNGWDGAALWTIEQTVIWTSPSSTLAAGSVVYIYDDNIANAASLMNGPGSVTGELPNLSSAGEQILAYTGSETNPSFIAAISNSGFEANCVTGTPNTNITCLPSPLVLGVSAQAPVNTGEIIPNLFFNVDAISGTSDEIIASLMNPTNWTTSIDVTIAGHDNWPNWEFIFTEQVSSVVTITPSSLSFIEGVSIQEFTLNFNPATTGAQSLSVDLSGAISNSDLNSNYTFSGNSILIDLPAATSSLNIQLNAVSDGIDELSEVGSLSISQLSSGLTLGSQDHCAVTILDSIGTFPTISLFINEVMSSNAVTISNEAGIYADWIELYNGGSTDIDLAGLYISDNINQLDIYQFPTGNPATILPAGAFKLIWADDSTALGALHVPFKIAAGGEQLFLSHGTNSTIIDSVSVPVLVSDESWGRLNDGELPWILFQAGLSTANQSNESAGILNTSAFDFSVFPNPASNYISINTAEVVSIEFFDISGRTCFQTQLNQSGAIDIENFPNGIYIVVVSTLTESKKQFKLIVSH